MLVMNRAAEMQNQIVYLTDSVQYAIPDTVFEQIHDTIIAVTENKVEKIYITDTIYLQ